MIMQNNQTAKWEFREKLLIAYQKLVKEVHDIDERASRRVELEGNVSICDVIAYQIGWGKLMLGWEAAEEKGQKTPMPAEGYKWNQLGLLAQSFYKAYQHVSLKELLNEFDKIVQLILKWIDALSEDELFSLQQREWAGDKWPLAKWIQVNTIAPYSSGRKKIRSWKKNKLDNGLL